MQWFRMYSEARNDRKLDTLSDAEFRVWFNLMCMAGESDQRGTVSYLTEELLAIEVCGGDVALLGHAMSRLVTLGMCDISDEGVTFVHWEKRQYDKPSDQPDRTRERKAAERERKAKSEMSRDVTPSHATYTENTQNRTDTENTQSIERTPPTPSPGETPKPKPRRVVKTPIPGDLLGFMLTEELESYEAMQTEQQMTDDQLTVETQRMVDHFKANGERKVDWVAAWRNWMRSPYRKPTPLANGRASPNGKPHEMSPEYPAWERAERIRLGWDKPEGKTA